jgi:hypothetical protein
MKARAPAKGATVAAAAAAAVRKEDDLEKCIFAQLKAIHPTEALTLPARKRERERERIGRLTYLAACEFLQRVVRFVCFFVRRKMGREGGIVYCCVAPADVFTSTSEVLICLLPPPRRRIDLT